VVLEHEFEEVFGRACGAGVAAERAEAMAATGEPRADGFGGLVDEEARALGAGGHAAGGGGVLGVVGVRQGVDYAGSIIPVFGVEDLLEAGLAVEVGGDGNAGGFRSWRGRFDEGRRL